MVEQFRARHSRLPEKIVIAPLACLALAAKQSLAPVWEGIQIECRDIQETEATPERHLAKNLAIFVVPEEGTGRLVSCDLKA
jgi:hypothetical protein